MNCTILKHYFPNRKKGSLRHPVGGCFGIIMMVLLWNCSYYANNNGVLLKTTRLSVPILLLLLRLCLYIQCDAT